MGCITITTKEAIPPTSPPTTPPLPTTEKEIPWGGVLLLIGGLAIAYLAVRR